MDKKTQDAEAAARAKTTNEAGGPNPDPVVLAPDNTGPDPLHDPLTTRTPIPPEETGKRAPVVRSPKDDVRDQIAARFRQNRTIEGEDDDSDAAQIRKFAREGMPPELVPLAEPPAADDLTEVAVAADEPEPEIAPEPAAPAKRKLKVRGKEIELTEEEMIAAAQKALAADDYLDEAKQKLADVNTLLNSTRQRATRTAPATEHPGDQTDAHTDVPEPAPADGAHPADDPYAKVIETIQYGDPKDAAQSLAALVSTAASQQSKDALRNERTRNDAIRTQKFLNDFTTAHPDLANDESASAVIEKKLFRLQREDLLGLGIEETKVPTSPVEIAQWHQYYRVEGHNVRDVPTLLTTARDEFLTWSGKAQPAPADTKVEQGPPRIAVTADRAARRTTVQQQPTRTVAPKPDAVVNPPPAKDRSSIVAQMRLNRAKPRGQVLAN